MAGVQKARAVIDRDFVISRIDSRIYGGFIEHMGRCVYGGIYQPQHSESDEAGFRRDVAGMVSELDVSVIRYPGGNFVSGFRWEDSVGPQVNRPTRMDLAWKSLETNEVGLDEFAKWASQVGSQVMMAVNLGTRGVEEAAHLLEYCNMAGESSFSKLRNAHGREQPYSFKLWCLGNEMDGPWQICNTSAAEYGLLAREAGKVMKRLDPTIELVACGSSSLNLPTYPDWDATVMEYCYDIADYLSVHMYLDNKEDDLEAYLAKSLIMDEYIDSIVAACDFVKAKKRSSKRMYLSFDEWNVVPSTWKGNDAESWTVGPALCEGSHTTADMIVFGSMLISLLKHSDRIRIACIAQLVNVFGVIMTDSDGRVWKQSIYYPFLHASRFGRGLALPVQMQAPSYVTNEKREAPLIEAVSVFDDDSGVLTVFAVNRSLSEELEMNLELRGFDALIGHESIVVQHENPSAYNKADAPDTIVPRNGFVPLVNDNRLSTRLLPLSWNVWRFKPAGGNRK
ncbi:arabinosylfuranosidase ArfA [Paenibacillus sp. Soil750]|uniref:arabinosylfuranosidase ArfA n=1 Tax=Paenibacillus sp. Soil750 TaxID=1736398 RepID=UPI0006F2D502|nr:alpha-N-arabinofuranosidase [Paenibacillus sp. Soil750]KRE64160.1 alpha-N-arabinofuranosidase [Paenibacillus sp. Soil750]